MYICTYTIKSRIKLTNPDSKKNSYSDQFTCFYGTFNFYFSASKLVNPCIPKLDLKRKMSIELLK